MANNEATNTCCFFGHKTIEESESLREKLCRVIENLIVHEKVDTFLFGSKSCFDSLCLNIVTKLKEKHPHIKRVYVRAEYPIIDESYLAYLLNSYDETYFPEKLLGAGKAVYVERNHEMIHKSRFCIMYYDKTYATTKRKSGTKLAYAYAEKHNRMIINILD